jgi:hypothetical protein
VFAALLVVAGCAQRDEVIAVIDVGEGGQAGAPPLVTFAASTSYGHSCGTVAQVALAHVDADEHLDVLSTGGCLSLHRGVGDGTVAGAQLVAMDDGTAMVLGHVDSQHHDDPTDPIDVVVRATEPRVLAGDGMGGFQHLHDIVGAGPGGPGSIRLGPIGGNTTTDLVTSAGAELVLWPGDGSGAFGPEHPVALADTVFAHALADLDGDGLLDVVVASGGVKALLNQGMASFASPIDATVQQPQAIRAIVTGSLDAAHDACADVLSIDGAPGAAGNDQAQVRVLLGDCHGGLGEHSAVAAPGVVDAAIADLNHDGHADLVIARAGSQPAVQLALGSGNGDFVDGGVHPVSGEPTTVSVGDLDGDGLLDVVVASRGVGVVVLLNRSE